MPIILLRVDERLIHGQVIVGWGVPLHADRVIVVDELLAASAWEQELYCLGLPSEIEAEFLSVDGARAGIANWRSDAQRTIVLVRDVATLVQLAGIILPSDGEINLGGVHHSPSRTECLPYLYLSSEERAMLQQIAGRGYVLSAQDLPRSRRVPLSEILARG